MDPEPATESSEPAALAQLLPTDDLPTVPESPLSSSSSSASMPRHYPDRVADALMATRNRQQPVDMEMQHSPAASQGEEDEVTVSHNEPDRAVPPGGVTVSHNEPDRVVPPGRVTVSQGEAPTRQGDSVPDCFSSVSSDDSMAARDGTPPPNGDASPPSDGESSQSSGDRLMQVFSLAESVHRIAKAMILSRQRRGRWPQNQNL